MAQHVRVNFQQSLTVDGHSSRLHIEPTRLDHLSQRRGTIDEVSSHPLGPFSAEEKHDDTAAVDGLKALDPNPPTREADIDRRFAGLPFLHGPPYLFNGPVLACFDYTHP
jgi:hypothetical protein